MDDKPLEVSALANSEPDVGVGLLPAPPAKLTTYAPEAWLGFHMRWLKWDRLKRQVRQLLLGNTNWWKEATVLFYGTALGSGAAVIAHATQSITFSAFLPVPLGAVIAGVICNIAYISIRRREYGSVEVILDTMDEIEAEFTRHSE